MKTMFAGAAAPIAAALMLAGCSDPQAAKDAEANAAAAAKAKAETARTERRLSRSVQCLSGLRWQQDALKAAKIGDLKIYQDYYREALLKDLGDKTLPAEGAKPELSKANLDAYLDWAYTNDVTTSLNAGKDADKDGTVTPKEASVPGRRTVVSCVLEVAEAGKGPLAGPDKIARMFQMEDLQKALKDKGA